MELTEREKTILLDLISNIQVKVGQSELLREVEVIVDKLKTINPAIPVLEENDLIP